MAVDILASNLTSGIESAIVGAISNIPGLDMVIKISQAIGIVVIIYILMLIVRSFMQMKQTLRIRQIAVNVEQINKKLDLLVGKKSSIKK